MDKSQQYYFQKLNRDAEIKLFQLLIEEYGESCMDLKNSEWIKENKKWI